MDKICLVLFLGLTLIYAFQGFYPESMTFFSNAFPPFIAGAAAISSAFTFLRYGRYNLRKQFSLMWFSFSLGLTLWFLGETVWAVYTLLLGIEIPYPSIADVFWLSGYIPFFVAMYLYVKIFGSVLSRRTVGITMVIVFILCVLMSAILITPIVEAKEDMLIMFIDFAYPFLDLVLFSMAVLGLVSMAVLGLAVFLKGNLGKSWLLINAGILSTTSADILFSYTTAQDTYYCGHPLELLFHLGYILFLLAFYSHAKELQGTGEKLP